MPPSYITFQARWRICDGSEQDVIRFNLALAALIRWRLDERDWVSVSGPCCSGILKCRDLRQGVGAVQAALRELHLHEACDVLWLDMREIIWRGIGCPDDDSTLPYTCPAHLQNG